LPRTLRVDFAAAEVFHREHTANLANGGVFIESAEAFSLREPVCVELVLGFCNERVTLEGEVVHIVPPEMAEVGGRPGVAVQFNGSPAEISRKLAPLAAASGTLGSPVRQDSGRRRSPRVAARVPARIEGSFAELEGTTRNLSKTGVLIAVPGGGVSAGQQVRVTLEHPTTGEAMEVVGTVARAIETAGEVAAVGIDFDPPTDHKPELERFVEQVQSVEHTRRLGGINGRIEELGPQTLLQMFGGNAPAGTLVLRRGEDEGLIGFENKLLRYARLGAATGMKALVRMLAWKEGSFEFHARMEPADEPDPPLPLEAAVFEAGRELHEAARIDLGRVPLDATVAVAAEADQPQLGAEPLSKLEAAVIDLARAGFPVRRIVDVIPEADPEILHALESLADRGLISFEN